MNAHLSFQGMPILYKAFNNQKEIDLEFMGTTLADLVKALSTRYGAPVKEALLNESGDLDAEVRVTLNDNYLSDNRMAATLQDGDAVAFRVSA
jgi:hypothetical protein